MQQIGTALPLASQIVRAEVCGQIAIGRWIPLCVIDAVQNSNQISGPRVQDAFQLLAKLRRLNLFGVFPADGCQHVGENQAALQEVEVVKLLHLVQGEEVPGKEKALRGDRREPSLVAGVVNGQHSP